MLDDKKLIELIRYIEFETNYDNKYEFIEKVRQYGYDIFTSTKLTDEERKIIGSFLEI